MNSFEKRFIHQSIPVSIEVQFEDIAIEQPHINHIQIIATLNGIIQHNAHTSQMNLEGDLKTLEFRLRTQAEQENQYLFSNPSAKILDKLGYQLKP